MRRFFAANLCRKICSMSTQVLKQLQVNDASEHFHLSAREYPLFSHQNLHGKDPFKALQARPGRQDHPGMPQFPRERASRPRSRLPLSDPTRINIRAGNWDPECSEARDDLLHVFPGWGSAQAAALHYKHHFGLVQVVCFHSVAWGFKPYLVKSEFQGQKCQLSVCGCPLFGNTPELYPGWQRASLCPGTSPAACNSLLQALHASAKAKTGQKHP